MSVSDESVLNMRRDSKQQYFEKRAYNRKKVEAKDFHASLLIESRQLKTVGMISQVRQALSCIRRHIPSQVHEEIRTSY